MRRLSYATGKLDDAREDNVKRDTLPGIPFGAIGTCVIVASDESIVDK